MLNVTSASEVNLATAPSPRLLTMLNLKGAFGAFLGAAGPLTAAAVLPKALSHFYPALPPLVLDVAQGSLVASFLYQAFDRACQVRKKFMGRAP